MSIPRRMIYHDTKYLVVVVEGGKLFRIASISARGNKSHLRDIMLKVTHTEM